MEVCTPYALYSVVLHLLISTRIILRNLHLLHHLLLYLSAFPFSSLQSLFFFFFSFFNNRNDDAPLCQTNLSRSCCCRHRYLRSSACEYLLPLGILGYVTCLLMSLLDSGTILEGPVVFLRKCELDGLLSLGRRRGSQTLQRSGCCPQLCAAEPAADQPVTFRYFFFARHRGKERTSFPSIRKCGWSRCQGLGPPESSSEHLPVQLPQ